MIRRPASDSLHGFLGAAALVSALSALAGTYGIVQLGFVKPEEFAQVAPSWAIGDFIGIAMLSPLLLVRLWPVLNVYLQYGHRKGSASSRTSHHPDIATTAVIVCSLFAVFVLPWHLDMAKNFPLLALLMLVPLAGIAWRFGLRETVLAVIVLDSGLVCLISFFGQRDQALQYQIVMLAIALVGLWLGGGVDALNRVAARYRDFASISNDLLWETNREGRLINASGQLASELSLHLGQTWLSLFDAPVPEGSGELRKVLASGKSFRNLEFEIVGDRSTSRWLRLSGLPLINDAGELSGYRGTAVDVTKARRAEALLQDYAQELRTEVSARTLELQESHRELADKERHLQLLLAAAPVGVLEVDNELRCRYINANGGTLVGLAPEAAIGQSWLDFVHDDDRAYVRVVWANNNLAEDVRWLEFRLMRTNLRCTAHWINIASDEPSLGNGAIIVLTNATARSQNDVRLWSMAHQDSLTELPNRNLFRDRLGQALRDAKRRASKIAVLWIDLDGFKAINDNYGHAAGDHVLQQVALRMRTRVRSSDTLARMGGDEFAVIMPDVASSDDAIQIATALAEYVGEPLDLSQATVRVTTSIGIALYPDHTETSESLVQCADMAMYHAKHAGKNRVQVWSGSECDSSGSSLT